ncbi:DUF1934 domain-containing protein [Oceanobacillus halophilus]|uniref:DUF1934 domain-containing protein n=1 Tax=Oceanobacillus halophilus TaxID=930130 RepID=A0A494ZXS5_9BACI|nr:DUF1934 domain-containing protein [Oceanobacillus halophilus]RKQ31543.1 DUF1934 domain-containing protein [Oceanobacillus halophilus]
MDSVQKKVNIRLETTINDNGSKEHNTVQETGKFFIKGNRHVLMFEETLDEELKVRNLVTIQDGSVNIKRTGPVSMNQKFDINHITENVYKHPHGTIHMETFTKKMTYKQKSEITEGQLAISYTVKLNGQDERKHDLILSYKEESE